MSVLQRRVETPIKNHHYVVHQQIKRQNTPPSPLTVTRTLQKNLIVMLRCSYQVVVGLADGSGVKPFWGALQCCSFGGHGLLCWESTETLSCTTHFQTHNHINMPLSQHSLLQADVHCLSCLHYVAISLGKKNENLCILK